METVALSITLVWSCERLSSLGAESLPENKVRTWKSRMERCVVIMVPPELAISEAQINPDSKVV